MRVLFALSLLALLVLATLVACTSAQDDSWPAELRHPVLASQEPISRQAPDALTDDDDRYIKCPGGYAKTSDLQDYRGGT
jgi:hypothetical protein